MPKRTPHLLEVIQNELITPHMRRIILDGSPINDFPLHHESANFKLLLSPFPDDTRKPTVRTYTLRHYNPTTQELWVDFMLHDAPGPAASWAISATPGNKVGFAGPGRPKLVDTDADWFLLAGDMSALPAIAANIERLPTDAKGYVILEILDEADKQALPFPRDMEVTWCVNPHPDAGSNAFIERVTSAQWLTGSPAVWVAGETSAVRTIRRTLKSEHDIERGRLYTSGYWQIGLTEDRHQILKRQDAESSNHDKQPA